jgi:hypothetical protein
MCIILESVVMECGVEMRQANVTKTSISPEPTATNRFEEFCKIEYEFFATDYDI